jgi:ABC-type phosphate transport system substrate-binding protein
MGGSQGDAYPLTTYSWLLMPRHGLGPKASVLQQAVAYGLSAKGQQQAGELGYASLPAPVRASALGQLGAIQP